MTQMQAKGRKQLRLDPAIISRPLNPADYRDRKILAVIEFMKANPDATLTIQKDEWTGARGGTVRSYCVQARNAEGTCRHTDASHTQRGAQYALAQIENALGLLGKQV